MGRRTQHTEDEEAYQRIGEDEQQPPEEFVEYLEIEREMREE